MTPPSPDRPAPPAPSPEPRVGPPAVTFRPGGGFVLLQSGWGVVVLLAIALTVQALAIGWGGRAWLIAGALAGALLWLLWQLLVWLCERYTLTPDAAVWESGVLRRLRVDVPLTRVQNTAVYRSLGERLLGLGTIGVATAGTGGYELVWRSVEHPEQVHDRLRQAVARATGARTGDGTRPPPVIGLTGGIGSGKSTVAAILGELGCLVIDSDRRARAALDRPDVRARLVEWWGQTILDPSGRIDRSRVAAIVFDDPDQRTRLESLVHPIVRQDRAAMIAEAAGQPFKAVIIDAPLLFEAGLDRECDAVIFVDAPRKARLERVRSGRDWSKEELDRRERAQIDLAEKRRRSSDVVDNSGDLTDLRHATRTVLDQILARVAGRP